jgi:hypothetical protein
MSGEFVADTGRALRHKDMDMYVSLRTNMADGWNVITMLGSYPMRY